MIDKIKTIEEYNGPMPDDLYEKFKNMNKQELEEAFRLAVRETKEAAIQVIMFAYNATKNFEIQ